jgi:uncharacterized protein
MGYRLSPLPDRPWLMRMRWCDLLFTHWVVDPRLVRTRIPQQLELDLFDGRAYLSAAAFRMQGVAPRLLPNLPGFHSFPELNLRTYVTLDQKPGVWFFSLDAGNKLAVRAARRFFYLPYFDATFKIANAGRAIEYSAVRTHRGAGNAAFLAVYGPAGEVYRSATGSLDSWLTDRYCLYAADDAGNVYRGEIDHAPWPLQPATATVRVNTLGEWLGLRMKGPPDPVHFAKSLDVHAWSVDRL